MEKRFYVYILASRRNGTLYVGMTSNLARRIDEHKSGAVPGFTSEYGIKTLVYYEVYDDAENAIRREKRLKRWNRDWKLKLIEKDNPNWRDLTELLNC
ncbi:GIY-YIG nuclease family protein [Azospirillum sp. sgz302134]